MKIRVYLNLSKYSVEELLDLYEDGIISKMEFDCELHNRSKQ